MQKENNHCGGVTLIHSLADGKHHYEVGNVLTDAPNTFGRKGDYLMKINDVDTQDLPPDRLAKNLLSGAPLLTIHQVSLKADQRDCLKSDAIRPYQKEQTTLSFKMAMVREESLEVGDEDNMRTTDCDLESDDMEEFDKELLMVSLIKTSVTVVRGRCCDSAEPCKNCSLSACNLSNVIMAAEKSELQSIRKELLRKHSESRLLINSYLNSRFSSEAISPFSTFSCSDMPISEDITIFYYMSTAPGKGIPVVLNFTGSNNYLKCSSDNKNVYLTIECCEKEKMKEICENDPVTWPFVFYMSASKGNMRQFESAAKRGWFIQTKAPRDVTMGYPTDENREKFYFFIFYNSKK